MVNGASLAVVALLGLFNGLVTDGGVSVWRVCAYPLLALVAYLHGRFVAVNGGGWILAGVALAAVPLGLVISPEQPPASLWESVSGLISLAVVVVLPWLAARSRRQQAELVRAGRREVEQLKREREYVSERARARERARIATDVHDSLGHELALIALRAGALELSPELSDPNRRAAQELRASAVKATDRLRETIGMLREDAAPVEPADETVAELVERAVAAGMDVTLTIDPPAAEPISNEMPPHEPTSGQAAAARPKPAVPLDQPAAKLSDEPPPKFPAAPPHGPVANPAFAMTAATHPALPPEPATAPLGLVADFAPESTADATHPAPPPRPPTLPPVVDRAVHRVVREALTNAARHAPGVPVTVGLCHNDTTLDVTITNPIVASAPARPGAGSGLTGLAERVRLLGGEFSAGPAGTDFVVSARLPLKETP